MIMAQLAELLLYFLSVYVQYLHCAGPTQKYFAWRCNLQAFEVAIFTIIVVSLWSQMPEHLKSDIYALEQGLGPEKDSTN